ncbi:hypothetical protein ACFYXC_20110 [Streptomyces sp. NPDC002701]
MSVNIDIRRIRRNLLTPLAERIGVPVIGAGQSGLPAAHAWLLSG